MKQGFVDVLRIGQPGYGFTALRWAAVLLPLLLFVTAAAWSWYGNRSETLIRLGRTLDMLNEHALRSLETQEATMEAVEQRLGETSWPDIATSAQVHTFLKALSDQAAPSGGMLLIDPDGFAVTGSARFPVAPLDVRQRDYFIRHRDAELGTYLGEVIRAQPQNYSVFTVSRRRRGGAPPGVFNGVIVASFKPNHFESFYSSVAETPRDVLALVRGDGALLARTPVIEWTGTREKLQLSLLQQARDAGRATASARSSIDGISRTYLVRKIANYDAYVVYGIDNAAIRARWLANVIPYAVICGVAALMLSLLTRQTQLSVRNERAALAAAHNEAERRADAEAMLRHSQRIDALGRMVGGVAHDFRNVVSAVAAGSRSIVRHAGNPAEVERIADMIEKAADRGARLTNRMMSFARRDENRTKLADIAPSMESVLDLLSHTLGPGYRVVTEIGRDLPPIQGDETEFETVIINLILNSRDAMPGGGTITISAALAALDDGTPAVLLTVEDDGIGMDEATLARAGEAFFTTKPPGKGTGLGLAMARGFAEQGGGRMTITSRVGHGTTVTLALGLYVPDGEPADA